MPTYPCENCGAPIEVRPRELAIVCRECGYEQRLSGVDPGLEPARQQELKTSPVATAEPLEPLVPQPSGVLIDDDGYRLRIRRRWFSFGYIPLLFFCIAWDSFLFFWYAAAFGDPNAPWLMVLFPVFHVAIGVGLTYAVLAGLLNTTTITADPQELVVRHRPIPWSGNLNLPVQEIRQLFVKREKARRNNSEAYSLHALRTNRRQVKLLSGLVDASQGQYIEQEVERHLGIAPERVKGEVKH
ncbi:MAG: hypothetical protein WD851_16920 [Pirellulales bacterium]